MYISLNEYVPACIFLIFHFLNMLIYMLLHIFVTAWNIRVSHTIFCWKQFDIFFEERSMHILSYRCFAAVRRFLSFILALRLNFLILNSPLLDTF